MLARESRAGGRIVALVYPHGRADAPGDVDQVPMMGVGIL
jgi:ribosomal protein L25 (general stress protein Ctc)